MPRRALFVPLIVAAFCFGLAAGQEAEHPILQPSSRGLYLAGPALTLECVAALSDFPKFLAAFRAKSPEERRSCLSQLARSLTPEPEFTTAEFLEIERWDPRWDPKPPPKDPELARRIFERTGVNLYAAGAINGLAMAYLISDPSIIHSLIECLNHPVLFVSKTCDDALEHLTRHTYGWSLYNGPAPPTVERRERMVEDWTEWENQLKKGHPIFDEPLVSECSKAVHAMGVRLTDILKGTLASGYLDVGVVKNPRGCSTNEREELFEYSVGLGMAANWPPGTKVDWVAIKVFRPGILRPRSGGPVEAAGTAPPLFVDEPHAEYFYTEEFPALDLEVRVEVASDDVTLRSACFLALKEVLTGLRDADRGATPRQ